MWPFGQNAHCGHFIAKPQRHYGLRYFLYCSLEITRIVITTLLELVFSVRPKCRVYSSCCNSRTKRVIISDYWADFDYCCTIRIVGWTHWLFVCRRCCDGLSCVTLMLSVLINNKVLCRNVMVSTQNILLSLLLKSAPCIRVPMLTEWIQLPSFVQGVQKMGQVEKRCLYTMGHKKCAALFFTMIPRISRWICTLLCTSGKSSGSFYGPYCIFVSVT